MNIINQVEYDEWKEKQSGDGYGLGIFAFAERWGNAMEEKMSNGEKLEDIAKQTSYDVAEGIAGFMYGCAVAERLREAIHKNTSTLSTARSLSFPWLNIYNMEWNSPHINYYIFQIISECTSSNPYYSLQTFTQN